VAAPSVAETEFLLGVAGASGGLVQGVVGWVDLAAADAPAILERLAQDPLLKSIRPMLQDIADPEWILRAGVDRGIAAAERLGLR
jgi:L-fuconolactonase